jgi:hypothetical protein
MSTASTAGAGRNIGSEMTMRSVSGEVDSSSVESSLIVARGVKEEKDVEDGR